MTSKNVESFDKLHVPFYDKGKEDVSFGEYDEKKRGGFVFYDMLKQELKVQKEGGSDIHFSQIDIDNLSNKVLDLYRKYKRGSLSENDLKNFRESEARLSKDEVNFVAMILNWVIKKEIEERAANRIKKAA